MNSTKPREKKRKTGILKYLDAAKITANINPNIPANTVRERLVFTPCNNSTKNSVDRYISQYFWNIRRTDKKVDGVLAKLGFIKVVKNEGEFEIYLTKEGIEFLKLKNNVIGSIENGLNHTLGYEKNLQSIS